MVELVIDMDAKYYATEIVRKLVKHGYIGYFAGGWVRDFLLKHPSSDIDIATNAPSQVILDLFPHTILVGLAFGVVIVVIEGHQFEVTTFRKDIDYSGGRRPKHIEMSTPQCDASRRDFTINGMFYDPIGETIYDYVGGVADLEKGIIRTIGNADERFIEDRLRMIRAVRFACRFSFYLDAETEEGIIASADTLFPPVAMERVWQELNKMAAGPRFDHALVEMHRLGLLPVIFPALQDVHLNTIKQRVRSFALFPEGSPTVLYLRELFPHMELEDLLDMGRQLRISTQDLNYLRLAEACRELVDKEKETSAHAWVDFYAHRDAALIFKIDAASRVDRDALLQRHRRRLELYAPHIERLAAKRPLITSAWLKDAGIPGGRLMGMLLKEAERIAILHDIHEPEKVMAKLKNSALGPKSRRICDVSDDSEFTKYPGEASSEATAKQ
jgi:poly(A) polymerase